MKINYNTQQDIPLSTPNMQHINRSRLAHFKSAFPKFILSLLNHLHLYKSWRAYHFKHLKQIKTLIPTLICILKHIKIKSPQT